MRYSGGLLGGSWLAALTSDLGHGKFNGSWLVQNFENLNPSNTYWSKQCNLYSKIDTEAERYLGFERWWGGHVNLNAEEIQFIVDELFVGNKLVAGEIETFKGYTIDLRNIRSPIVVFCSKGDNITPPQQALHWILDLYDDVDDIRSHGQTIVYTIHETIGHLGIFVSSGVARKEHSEFSSNIDLVDVLPPGLYEAIFEKKTAESPGADLASGDWVMRCEARTFADIRALGGNDAADERSFAAVAKVSEINLALYRTYLQPLVRAMSPATAGNWLRKLHPLELQYELFGDSNPIMSPLRAAADWVRKNRMPVAAENPLAVAEQGLSRQIVAALDAWRDLRDGMAELMFFSVYGAPAFQAAVGVDPSSAHPLRKAGSSVLHREMLAERVAQLKSRISTGGIQEAVIRAMLYAGMPRQAIDERALSMLRRIRAEQDGMPPLALQEFKTMVRQQFCMLHLEPEAAVEAIPNLLPREAEVRHKGLAVIRGVLSARGEIEPEVADRLQYIARLFGVDTDIPGVTRLPTAKRTVRPKAS